MAGWVETRSVSISGRLGECIFLASPGWVNGYFQAAKMDDCGDHISLMIAILTNAAIL